MATTHPVMTFRCPRCGITEELYVSPAGQMQSTRNGVGMAFGINYEHPRESTILCGCSQDDGEDAKTEMRLISERES